MPRIPRLRTVALAALTLTALVPAALPQGAVGQGLEANQSVKVVGPNLCTTTVCYFDPSSVSVNLGDTVTWTNEGDGDHTVTTTSGPESFDSGTMEDGDVFSWTFTKPGTVQYWCAIHGNNMGTGSVTVINRKPSAAITAPAQGDSVFGGTLVQGTASDPDGALSVLKRVEVNIANGGWQEAINDGEWATWHWEFSASGDHGANVQVQARATDDYDAVSPVVTVNAKINRPPLAGFTYAPPSPTTADVVVFTDATTDEDGFHDLSSWSWTWEFDGGSPSTQRNASYRFPGKGDHTAKLTVKDDHGASGTATKTITVNNSAPQANFTVTPADPAVNESVAFTDKTLDYDGDASNWKWDFGDGNTSTERNTTHVYKAAGTYKVKLNVTDAEGASGILEKTLEVVAIATKRPVAELSANVTQGRAPLLVRFSLDGHDEDGTIASWKLDFGDNATQQGGGATLPLAVPHTYQRAGSYDVLFTVTDNATATATNRTTISVEPPPNLPPSASFTVSPGQNARKGQPLTFRDASSDPDAGDAVARWEWVLGDGTRRCCDQSTLDHAYATAGDYTARLTVTDTRGATSTAQLTIHVAGSPPDVLLHANSTSGRAPFPVSLTLAARDADGRVESWVLDFGDGSPRQRGEGAPPNATVRHLYERAATYAVQFDVFDDDGLAGRAVVFLEVAPALPPPLPLPPGAIVATPTGQRLTYLFTAAVTLQGNLSYRWAFGDGMTAVGREVEHSYDATGTYAVTLTVLSPEGPSAEGSTSLSVVEESLAAQQRVRSEVASGVVRVSWSPDPRAGGYQVWRREGAGQRFEEVAVVQDATSYSDLDVEDGVGYAYRVTFFSPSGEGRLQRLTQLNSTEAFRLLGEVRLTGLVDTDADGVGDSRDLFPLDASRSTAGGFPAWLVVLLLVLAALGLLGWRYRGTLAARFARPPPPRALTDIPGLLPEHAAILRGAGVPHTAALAEADPAELARRIVLSLRQLEPWHRAAKLLRVRGISPGEAMLLVRAGVRGPEDLARADPQRVARSVTPPIPEPKVSRWVRAARRATGEA